MGLSYGYLKSCQTGVKRRFQSAENGLIKRVYISFYEDHGILIIVGKQGQVAFTGDIIAHNSKTSFLPLIYVVLTESAAPCGTVRVACSV